MFSFTRHFLHCCWPSGLSGQPQHLARYRFFPSIDQMHRPTNNTHAGEVINSMRLSEARSLLSRYEKNKSKNGEAVAAGSGAVAVAAVDLEKDLPPADVEMAAGGVSADEEAGVGMGGAVDVHGVEQRLMRLTETAVMALTQVWCMVFLCLHVSSSLRVRSIPSSCVNLREDYIYRKDSASDGQDGVPTRNSRRVPRLQPNEVRTLAVRV